MASRCKRYRNECTRVRQALARLPRTEAPDDTKLQQPDNSTQEDDGWHERNSECWNGTVTLKLDPVHGSVGIGALGRKPGTAPGMKHKQRVSKALKKHHLCSQGLCPPGAFYRRVVWRQEREEHDTGRNWEQTSA